MGVLQKILGTSSSIFKIGNNVAGNKVIQAGTSDSANPPSLRFNDTSKLWEISNDGTSWGTITSSATSVFGTNYQTAIALARTTTTSATYQDKVTLTTGALTGTHRIGWVAVLDSGSQNSTAQVRLYNVTDAATLGAERLPFLRFATSPIGEAGFGEVVFTGSAKTFRIQFASPNGTTTIGIQDARIEIWRVS